MQMESLRDINEDEWGDYGISLVQRKAIRRLLDPGTEVTEPTASAEGAALRRFLAEVKCDHAADKLIADGFDTARLRMRLRS